MLRAMGPPEDSTTRSTGEMITRLETVHDMVTIRSADLKRADEPKDVLDRVTHSSPRLTAPALQAKLRG